MLQTVCPCYSGSGSDSAENLNLSYKKKNRIRAVGKHLVRHKDEIGVYRYKFGCSDRFWIWIRYSGLLLLIIMK